MNYTIKNLKLINVFSFLISILFLGTLFSVGGKLKENVFGIPLLGLFILWSESAVPLIYANELKQSAKERFTRDFFLISYSFYFASLVSLILQHNNAELMGWWLFYVYIMTFVGLISSLVFSGLALYLGPHKKYTVLCSLILILMFAIEAIFPWHIPIDFLNYYVASWIDVICLLLIHTTICFIKLIKRIIK